jgi:NADH dehydrogenase FAD-containing subunit
LTSAEAGNFTTSSRYLIHSLDCLDADFTYQEDLKSWYPELADKIKITLVEALPSVLPMFSKRLIEYTMSTFKESKIDILTQTMVKEV